jgi:hypothetical protein
MGGALRDHSRSGAMLKEMPKDPSSSTFRPSTFRLLDLPRERRFLLFTINHQLLMSSDFITAKPKG